MTKIWSYLYAVWADLFVIVYLFSDWIDRKITKFAVCDAHGSKSHLSNVILLRSWFFKSQPFKSDFHRGNKLNMIFRGKRRYSDANRWLALYLFIWNKWNIESIQQEKRQSRKLCICWEMKMQEMDSVLVIIVIETTELMARERYGIRSIHNWQTLLLVMF